MHCAAAWQQFHRAVHGQAHAAVVVVLAVVAAVAVAVAVAVVVAAAVRHLANRASQMGWRSVEIGNGWCTYDFLARRFRTWSGARFLPQTSRGV